MGRTPLVGRKRQLAQLCGRLERACGGAGGVLLLAGEAGIGKSRLVVELKALAQEEGFLVLQGNCFEPDRSVPYAPIADLLRGWLAGRSPSEVAEALGGAAPEVARLLPELTQRLPGLTTPPEIDPDQDRLRLVHTLIGLLLELATRPLLLVLEDLHWSDDGSLDFLLALARQTERRPVLLALTYRSDEAHDALRHLVAELERERLAQELPLARLAQPDVDAMLRAIFSQDQPIRRDFLDVIFRLTDGNPFFIEEVITALIATGEIFQSGGVWDRRPVAELRIPRTVQDAVQRRLRRVSEAAWRVLTTAAVAGQRFDFSLLADLGGHDEDGLLTLIKELIAAQFVVEESADRFSFRHALIRQAVESELLARERLALHRAIAEALERRHAHAPEPYLGELAHHFFAAGVWDKALDYARRAGEQAQAMYAPRAAAEYFTHAIEAARALGVAPAAHLHRLRGLAYETLGEFERARSDLEAAVALATANGDGQCEWQSLLNLGFLWAARDYGEADRQIERALALARAMEEPATIAHSLNRAGNLQMMAGRPQDARPYHELALSLFEQLEDRHGLAETLDLLGLATMHGGNAPLGALYYERAATLYRELDERRGLITSLAMLSPVDGVHQLIPLIPVPPGNPRPPGEAGEAVQMARDIGWRSGEAFALAQLTYAAAARGDFAAALAMAREALAIAEEIEHRQWIGSGQMSLGIAYFELGALAVARRYFEQALAAAEQMGSGYWQAWITAPLARVYCRQGELDRAAAVLDAVHGPDTPVETSTGGMCWLARAELLLACGEASAGAAVAARIATAQANVVPGAVVPSVWLTWGECLSAAGHDAEAESTLRTALETAQQYDAAPMQWQLRTALARFYEARPRHAEAEREAVAARAIVDSLAAGCPDEPDPELGGATPREQFLSTALAQLPQPRTATPLQAAKQAYAGLTAREREVAAQVARGLSNREIADALVVSERTVEYHVSNILAKLDATSRAQIAAWAVQRGLAGEGTSASPYRP
jgi:DNA-binding CsgD family transcriptional regulator/tetratricopeptide (TPR) repeat protein